VCADCPTRLARDLDSAFPEFLSHHQDLVYGLALRMTKVPADADDLAQDAFIRAYRALQGYDAERVRALRSRGWLASIVTNLGRNRAKRKPAATADLEGAREAAAEEDSRPEHVAERRESARVWRSRLDALPPHYGRAVELRHVQGLSYPELAEALGRPLGTVKSDVHRGVELLRRSLVEESDHQEASEVMV
jgi:RNA polymerase sigma-70 factor (ECF subfamily)